MDLIMLTKHHLSCGNTDQHWPVDSPLRNETDLGIDIREDISLVLNVFDEVVEVLQQLAERVHNLSHLPTLQSLLTDSGKYIVVIRSSWDASANFFSRNA